MKNLRKGLLGLAVLAGITGAVAVQVSAETKTARLVDYSWTHYDTDGTTVLESNVIKSLDDAKSDFGCDEGTTRCARGTAPNQPEINLYYPD
ncbi:hypothetical protein QFZ20_002266 [Flavobacterium sp. W4I14]|nr:hypothetical protein [Flavobacterium sp. W4I14]